MCPVNYIKIPCVSLPARFFLICRGKNFFRPCLRFFLFSAYQPAEVFPPLPAVSGINAAAQKQVFADARQKRRFTAKYVLPRRPPERGVFPARKEYIAPAAVRNEKILHLHRIFRNFPAQQKKFSRKPRAFAQYPRGAVFRPFSRLGAAARGTFVRAGLPSSRRALAMR